MKIEEQKQLFKNMSDCYADTWYLNEDGVYVEGQVIQAMTEERFVKAVSQVTSSASGDASDFESELYRLLNAHTAAGLKKHDLISKMEYVTESCRVS